MVLTIPRPTPTRAALWPEVVQRPENRSALVAVRRLARALTRRDRFTLPFPTLFLCGPSGTGKTHLVNALLKRVVAGPAVRTVQTLPAHDLTPNPDGTSGDVDFADLEHVDLLIIEDIQHLAKSTLTPLSQLIEARGRRRLASVFTANVSPNRVKRIPQRLLSRLTAGLVTPLAAYGAASREEVLRHAALERSVHLTGDAFAWLASLPTGGGLRPLLGQLDLLKSRSRGQAAPLTLAMVQDRLSHKPPSSATVERIVAVVAGHYGIKPKDLLGPSRLRSVLLARQVAMALARDLTGLTLPRIGDCFGGRDHTTVLHAVRKITVMASEDKTFAATLSDLKSQLA